MRRIVTAIYPSHGNATLVRNELERAGFSRQSINIIPDGKRQDDHLSTTSSGNITHPSHAALVPVFGEPVPLETNPSKDDMGGPYGRELERLHDLHLPKEDTRTYHQAILNGDHIVAIEVDDADVTRVREIMRSKHIGLR